MNDSTKRALILVLATCGFGGAMLARDDADPWVSNIIVASVTAALGVLVLGRRGRAVLFQATAKGMAIALVFGLAMSVATHWIYQGAVHLAPSLQPKVAQLYADISPMPALPVVIAMTIVVVFAEEVIWRGVAFELLSPAGTAIKVIGSTLLYTLPQVIAGVPILIAAAFALGIVTAIIRQSTRSLVYPITIHGIWSVSTFCLFPLHTI